MRERERERHVARGNAAILSRMRMSREMTLLGIVSMTRVTQVIWIGVYTYMYICSVCKHISLVATAFIVVYHVRGKCCKCCCCKDKSRSSKRHLYCLSTSSLGCSPFTLFFLPPSHTLPRPYQAVCVWVCLLLLLCTIVHSSLTVNYYYEPALALPALHLSLFLSV